MWTKTININYKNKLVPIQVWLSGETTDNKAEVSVQAMYNEYFILEEILFQSRDAAYDFIKHYSPERGKAFFIREGYSTGAFN